MLICCVQLLFENQLVIYICAGLVKIGVAFVLLRLVTKRGLRLLLYGSMVVVVAWTIVMTLYASYFCASSGSSNWAGSKTCEAVGYFRTSSNIVIDYFCKFTVLRPFYESSKIQSVVLILDRRLPSHLHPLGRTDEPEVEAERASPSWTGSLVSTNSKFKYRRIKRLTEIIVLDEQRKCSDHCETCHHNPATDC